MTLLRVAVTLTQLYHQLPFGVLFSISSLESSSRVSLPLSNLNTAMPTCSNTMLPFDLKNWKNTLLNSYDGLCGRKEVSHFFLNFNLIKCPNFAFYFTWFYFSAGLKWEGTEYSRQGPAGHKLCLQDWLVFPGYFLSRCCFYLMIFISHQQLPGSAGAECSSHAHS